MNKRIAILLALLGLLLFIFSPCYAWMMDRRTMQMGNQDSVAAVTELEYGIVSSLGNQIVSDLGNSLVSQ